MDRKNDHSKLESKSRTRGWAITVALFLPLLALVLLLGTQRALARHSVGIQATLCVRPGGGDGCFDAISEALAAANTADIIQVAAGSYNENLVIEKNVTLEGGWNESFTARDPQTTVTTIRPDDPAQSVVSIIDASPTLDGFTITGGRAALGGNHGGGLRLIDSEAIVRHNTIVSNTAYLLGGGLWIQRGAPRLENNRIEHNRSVGPGQDAFGGGVQLEDSNARLIDNIISGNEISGTMGYGGGVDVQGGAVTLLQNTVRNNIAPFGGGIHVSDDSSDTGLVTIVDSRIVNNIAGHGAGLYNSDTLKVTGGQISDNVAKLADSGGGVYNAGDLLLRDVIVNNNSTNSRGGGLANYETATLSNVTISGNAAITGGGIYNGGTLILSDSLVSANSADDDGGGIYSSGPMTVTNSTVSGNQAAQNGGGIYQPAGTATLRGITVSDNQAQIGGGIHIGVDMRLESSTISNNSAKDRGGGVYFPFADIVSNFANVTISSNAANEGGGIAASGAGAVELANTILAGNTGGNCAYSVVTAGYNLEDADTCNFDPAMNDIIDTDPLLGPLQDNGGPTLTHAIGQDSPAVDAADNDACPNADQRGRPRVDGDFDGTVTCDIGAYETLLSFTVNSTADVVDEDPGDGSCDTGDRVGDEPECTLRAAIIEANALGGAELISVPAGLYLLTIENPEPVSLQTPNVDSDDFALSGDLDLSVSLAIQGAGADVTLVDANGIDRVFHVNPDLSGPDEPPTRVELSDLTIQNGVGDLGAGIANHGELTVANSVIRENSADSQGGAIFNAGQAILTLIHSTVTGNSSQDGAGIHTDDASVTTIHTSTISFNSAAATGGGLNNGGTLTMTHSAIHDNTTIFGGAGIRNNGNAFLQNVTLSGNDAGDFGGALRNANSVTLNHVTIGNNQTAEEGAGIYNDGGATTTMINTVIANHSGDNCAGDPPLSLGHNLEDADTCDLDPAEGDVITPDPRLEPLADNGGPTLTHALQQGSPAIDAADDLACPDRDQRGVARPQDGDDKGQARCDVGAYEYQLEGKDGPGPPPGMEALYLPLIIR